MTIVSVVIPVFNNADRLRNCLSGLKQVVTSEIQIIVIDDGSTDDSPVVATDFSDVFEHFTFLRIPENKGVGNARNLGIHVSRGRYIYFLDCDDEVSGNFSEALMSELKSDVDLVFTPVRQIPSGSNDSFLASLTLESNMGREYLLASLQRFESWPLECWGFFIRRQFLIDHQITFEQIRISEDMVFMTWVFSKLDKYSVAYDIFYIHHRTPGSLGKSFSTHDVESWFLAFLGLQKLANEVSIESLEGPIVMNRMKYTFSYLIISFLLSDSLQKKEFLKGLVGPERMDLLLRLAGSQAVEASREFDIFERFLAEASNNVRKLLNPVGTGKTYLWCYDRLSLGVFEIMKTLNFRVDAIIDDHCDLVIPSIEFGKSPVSPEILNEEILEGYTVIICHDKPSVFSLKQKQLKSFQERGLQIVSFTTADLVGDLPFEKLFTENF